MSLDRGTATRLSLKSLTRRLSLRSKDYNKVEDLYDTRIPLHNEDAFSHGLKFKAKFIGSLEISRPTCKVDIITAMRRIRYEFKVKGIRKARCALEVSMQGVKVTKRKRRSRKVYTEDQLFIMQHPIYRIFYVSHDSQDMKIFSYITRELPDSTFRCNVFKAYKKNMALHIVRSLGQAFDVCHRLNPRPKKTKKEGEGKEGEKGGEEGAGGANEKGASEGNAGEPSEAAKESDELGVELTAAMQQVSVGEGAAKPAPQPEQAIHKDLMDLDFDPFNFHFGAPVGAGALPNGSPHMAFESNFTSAGASGGAAAPAPSLAPFLMRNTTSGLPDLPEGSSQAAGHFAGRPRPRPVTSNQQNIIQENPFTDTLQTGSESPTLSIGEAIDGPEKLISNPFLADTMPVGQSVWEVQKQQMVAQMALMREQIKQETAARIESQARVEHLLLQNKQLLTHVQKLMVELEKLQSLQMAQLVASGVTPPAAVAAIPAKPKETSVGTSATPSLPAIPESTAEPEPGHTEPTPVTQTSPEPHPLAETPPTEAPPTKTQPLPVATPSTTSPHQEPAVDPAITGSSTSVTTVGSESDPFNLPPSSSQPEPGSASAEISQQTIAPAEASDTLDIFAVQPDNTEFPTPLPEASQLPTNDPFSPQ